MGKGGGRGRGSSGRREGVEQRGGGGRRRKGGEGRGRGKRGGRKELRRDERRPGPRAEAARGRGDQGAEGTPVPPPLFLSPSIPFLPPSGEQGGLFIYLNLYLPGVARWGGGGEGGGARRLGGGAQRPPTSPLLAGAATSAGGRRPGAGPGEGQVTGTPLPGERAVGGACTPETVGSQAGTDPLGIGHREGAS